VGPSADSAASAVGSTSSSTARRAVQAVGGANRTSSRWRNAARLQLDVLDIGAADGRALARRGGDPVTFGGLRRAVPGVVATQARRPRRRVRVVARSGVRAGRGPALAPPSTRDHVMGAGALARAAAGCCSRPTTSAATNAAARRLGDVAGQAGAQPRRRQRRLGACPRGGREASVQVKISRRGPRPTDRLMLRHGPLTSACPALHALAVLRLDRRRRAGRRAGAPGSD
jgi:hypothetical protein